MLISALLLLSLSGCARLQTMRVVDQSGQPVNEVQVERLQGGIKPSPMPFVLVNSLTPAEKKSTDKAGSVAFDKAGKQFMVNPSSKNSAYGSAFVTVTLTGAKVCYPAESREISVSAVDGVIEIPLPNRGISKPASPGQEMDAAFKQSM
jgi:hypothetical protein